MHGVMLPDQAMEEELTELAGAAAAQPAEAAAAAGGISRRDSAADLAQAGPAPGLGPGSPTGLCIRPRLSLLIMTAHCVG